MPIDHIALLGQQGIHVHCRVLDTVIINMRRQFFAKSREVVLSAISTWYIHQNHVAGHSRRRLSASEPLDASPVIMIPSSASSTLRRPRLATKLSSTRNTLISLITKLSGFPRFIKRNGYGYRRSCGCAVDEERSPRHFGALFHGYQPQFAFADKRIKVVTLAYETSPVVNYF